MRLRTAPAGGPLHRTSTDIYWGNHMRYMYRFLSVKKASELKAARELITTGLPSTPIGIRPCSQSCVIETGGVTVRCGNNVSKFI